VGSFSTDFRVNQTLFVLPPNYFWVKFLESWREGVLDAHPKSQQLKRIVEFALEQE
jgi:hypothetical protein